MVVVLLAIDSLAILSGILRRGPLAWSFLVALITLALLLGLLFLVTKGFPIGGDTLLVLGMGTLREMMAGLTTIKAVTGFGLVFGIFPKKGGWTTLLLDSIPSFLGPN